MPLLQLTSVVVCLWIFLPLILSSEMHAQSCWNQEIDFILPLQNIPLFYLQKLLGCFVQHRPIIFAPFDWIWAESISLYTSEFIRLLLSSVTSSLNTSNPVPLEAMHSYAITLLHHVSQMMLYALDHELFQAFSILFLPVILVQVDLNFSRPKNAFPEVVWLFEMFSAKV